MKKNNYSYALARKDYEKAYFLAETFENGREEAQEYCLNRLCNIVVVHDMLFMGEELISREAAKKKRENKRIKIERKRRTKERKCRKETTK